MSTLPTNLISHPSVHSERETNQSLRAQRPENDTGSFDPVRTHPILRSRTANSLPYDQRQLLLRQASRVPFAGLSCDTTTTMHDLRPRPNPASLAELSIRQGVLGVLGVSYLTPLSAGTPFSTGRSLLPRESMVRNLRCPGCPACFTKPLRACRRGRAPARRCTQYGFSNQPGHPGHLRKVTMLSQRRPAETVGKGVPPEDRSSRDTPGQPGHRRGWSA